MRLFALALPALLACACAGSRPERFAESNFGFSGLLVRGRILTPTGEMKEGRLVLNVEGDAERYRVDFEPGVTTVLRVEPDVYRLHPTRNLFGLVQRDLSVRIAGRSFRVPFPRSILRKEAIDLKPTRVAAVGVLEARLLPIERGAKPKIEVRLDDSVEARRALVQETIEMMMDPKVPVTIRGAAVSWTRALERALIDLASEEQARPAFKKIR